MNSRERVLPALRRGKTRLRADEHMIRSSFNCPATRGKASQIKNMSITVQK